MKNYLKLVIALGALVCVAVAAFVLVQWGRSEWDARWIHRWFQGGMVVRSFFNAGFGQYVVDHGDIPEAWKKLSYFPNTMNEQLGDPVDGFWHDVSGLPGSKKTPDGIVNFRVWFLDKTEMAKTNSFYYHHPYYPEDIRMSIDWPMAWVVYKEKGRTMVAMVAPDCCVMTADEFIKFLEHAMAYAKAHGIPYNPAQIDYIKNF